MVRRAQAILRPAADAAIEHTCAALVLASRMLSGRHAIASALVAAGLWSGMVLAELRIMGQVRCVPHGGAGGGGRGGGRHAQARGQGRSALPPRLAACVLSCSVEGCHGPA